MILPFPKFPLSEAQRTATLFHEQELVAVFKSSADDLSQVGGESGASKSVHMKCSPQPICQSHPPCPASPGRGSLTYDRGAEHRIARVRFKNWDINSPSRQLFSALHLHAIARFWVRVLAVVDLPSAFRLPF